MINTIKLKIKKWIWKNLFKPERFALYRAGQCYNEHWGNNTDPDKVILYKTESQTLIRVFNFLENDLTEKELRKQY